MGEELSGIDIISILLLTSLGMLAFTALLSLAFMDLPPDDTDDWFN